MCWLTAVVLLVLASTPAHAAPWQDAIGHIAAGELEAAERILLDAADDDAEAALYLGRVYLEQVCPEQVCIKQRRAQDAVDAFERAIELDPVSSEAHLWLGDALVKRIEEVPFLLKLPIANRMRTAYEKAVELDPENLAARVAVARYHAAAPAMAGGSRERAQSELAEIRTRDTALAHITQGLIHEHVGHVEPAEAELRAATEVDPESLLSWRELGYFFQRRERWQEAADAFEQVLNLAPDDAAALFETARCALLLSDQVLHRAERRLQAYLQLEPGPDTIVLGDAKPPRRPAASQALHSIHQRLGLDSSIAESQNTREVDISLSLGPSDWVAIEGWTDCLLNAAAGTGVR